MEYISKSPHNFRLPSMPREVAKVPVIRSYPVEAAQLTITNNCFSEDFLALLDNCVIRREHDNFIIHTEKQTLVINEGDYLIKTRIDRLLACTEKVFNEEYENTLVNMYKPLDLFD